MANRLRPADVLIISPDKTTHHGWVTTRTHAHEQYANEVKAKAESTPQLTPGIYDNTAPLLCVSAEIAYEAMMDALRDKIDPQMVEVKTNGGQYARIRQCDIRGVGGAQITVFELERIAARDHIEEIRTARAEIEDLVTDDFSM